MNELPLKQWIAAEASRLRCSIRTVESRLKIGAYPEIKIRRVNRRVVFVVIP